MGVRDGSSLQLLPRLRGGGGDGGSTGAESRSSFLEMYARKKPAKARCLSRLESFLKLELEVFTSGWHDELGASLQ